MSASGEVGIVCLGGRRYAVQRHFCRMPSDLLPARVSQVAVESSGRVHVLRRGEPPVFVYEPDGTFVRSYGAGEIFDSHGISIDVWDRVWVVDRDAHQIVVFDLSGQPILRIGERHRPKWEAPFNHPTRAAVALDGAVFVADGYGNARIHEFSAEGEWRSSFGEVGAGQRQFMTPHSLIVDREQRLLVCDRENDRVQVFNRDGKWLADWKGLCRPMDLCERDDGVILVTDQVPSVTAFAADGARIDRSRPSLNGAHGITFGKTARFTWPRSNPPR
jgi:hypothetical protein